MQYQLTAMELLPRYSKVDCGYVKTSFEEVETKTIQPRTREKSERASGSMVA
jgi:hypothetical protein